MSNLRIEGRNSFFLTDLERKQEENKNKLDSPHDNSKVARTVSEWQERQQDPYDLDVKIEKSVQPDVPGKKELPVTCACLLTKICPTIAGDSCDQCSA